MARTRTTSRPSAEAAPDLLTWIPQVSPHLSPPTWLGPIVHAVERAATEPQRLLVSTPPQHGKSELLFHAIAWLLRYTARPLLYLTYSDDFAMSQMRRARVVAADAGVPFAGDVRSLHEWRTVHGATLYATGIGGSITGRPGGIIIIDDPIKDWVAAQSRRIRDTVDDWLRSVVLTRMHPSSSIVLVQTRWHVDDIYGRLASRGWTSISLPALGEGDVALWPEERPAEWLRAQRDELGAHIFSALYQGEPRPRGGAVFGDATLTDEIPTVGRYAIGVDLAYSRRTSADYSVAVVLCRPIGQPATVVDVVRRQCQAPEFELVLRSLAQQYPGATMRAALAGTERGAADFLARSAPLEVLTAHADKFTRAQPVAAAWARGDVLVPRDAPWAPALLDELGEFTGQDDPHDDMVDALATAWDSLDAGAATITTLPSAGRRGARRLGRVW